MGGVTADPRRQSGSGTGLTGDRLDVAGARRDLYEILEERYGRRSTILTTQILVDTWHKVIGNPTYADAILDRLVHNAMQNSVRLVGAPADTFSAKQLSAEAA